MCYLLKLIYININNFYYMCCAYMYICPVNIQLYLQKQGTLGSYLLF